VLARKNSAGAPPKEGGGQNSSRDPRSQAPRSLDAKGRRSSVKCGGFEEERQTHQVKGGGARSDQTECDGTL